MTHSFFQLQAHLVKSIYITTRHGDTMWFVKVIVDDKKTIEWLVCGLPLGVWMMHEPFVSQLFTTKLNTIDYLTHSKDAKMGTLTF